MSFITIGHELRMIFSNPKDEARSQHEHLHGFDNSNNASINLDSNGQ
jgi:hypothetical protein